MNSSLSGIMESIDQVLCDISENTSNLQIVSNKGNDSLSRNEVDLSKLFKPGTHSKDPTATFFDLIGNNNVKTDYIENDSNSILLQNDPEVSCSSRITMNSEAGRRRDAWIPSRKTQMCLINRANSITGGYVIDKDLLTMPGVLFEEEQTDAIGNVVTLCLGETEAAHRRVLTVGDVTQDEKGLRDLIETGAYRAAINLTSKLLTIYGQGTGRMGHSSKHSPYSLQLWFTRIALLIKIKSFNIASAEAEPFGDLDKPDLYYQFYPEIYGSRPGSMATFSFRLLLAELPMYCNKPMEALNRLLSVTATLQQIIENLQKGFCEDGSPTKINESDKNDSLLLWRGRKTRAKHSVVNCALELKDYQMASEILEKLCKRENTSKSGIQSALGRLYLQLGNIGKAEYCFNEAFVEKENTFGVRELVDKGLLEIANNEYQEAYIYFQKANRLDPSNITILNNMSVCLLYSGQLKEAIKVLESAISLNPIIALQESLVLNLCTLYDMESSNGRMKKFDLLRQISRYQSDAPTSLLEKLYG